MGAIGRVGALLLAVYGFSAVFTYVEHFDHGHGDAEAVFCYEAGSLPEDKPGAYELFQPGLLRRYPQPCNQ